MHFYIRSCYFESYFHFWRLVRFVYPGYWAYWMAHSGWNERCRRRCDESAAGLNSQSKAGEKPLYYGVKCTLNAKTDHLIR